tara:strand:- start:2029 stop:2376 length:348 start_codon:yes stop_codon:yes gene_type:complete
MKTHYKTGNHTVEFESDTQTGLVEQIAAFEEVFSNSACGKCKETNLKWVVRTDREENKYYELRCASCGAKLSFGCNKVGGGMFPQRKFGKSHDKAGEYKPDGGWMKWNPKTEQEE